MSARPDIKFVHAGQDPWRVSVGEHGPLPIPPIAAHSLLTLEQWHAVRDQWPAGLPVGLTLANTLAGVLLFGDPFGAARAAGLVAACVAFVLLTA